MPPSADPPSADPSNAAGAAPEPAPEPAADAAGPAIRPPSNPPQPTDPAIRATPEAPEPAATPAPPRGPMFNGADGASAERTRLAWRRTTLAGTAVTLLTIRLAARGDVTALRVLAIVAAAIGWFALMTITQRRIGAMAADQPSRVGRTLTATALVIVGFAILGLALITDRSGG
jgi:hypothetical protein